MRRNTADALSLGSAFVGVVSSFYFIYTLPEVTDSIRAKTSPEVRRTYEIEQEITKLVEDKNAYSALEALEKDKNFADKYRALRDEHKNILSQETNLKERKYIDDAVHNSLSRRAEAAIAIGVLGIGGMIYFIRKAKKTIE